MNIQLFFQFPGILILIGVILLIIAIIIGVLAYRRVDDDEKTFDASEIDNNNFVNEPIKNVEEVPFVEQPVTEEQQADEQQSVVSEDEKDEVAPEITEAKIEEPQEVEEIKEEIEDNTEDFIIEDTVIKEDKEILDDQTFNDMIKKFDDAIENEEFVELNAIEPLEEINVLPDVNIEQNINIEEQPIKIDIKLENDSTNEIEPLLKDFIISDEEEEQPLSKTFDDELLNLDNTIVKDPFIFDEEETLNENIKEHQPIYGGINPLDNIKLDFNEPKDRPLYGDKNFVPSEPIIVDYEEKKPLEEDEEEIEML